MAAGFDKKMALISAINTTDILFMIHILGSHDMGPGFLVFINNDIG